MWRRAEKSHTPRRRQGLQKDGSKSRADETPGPLLLNPPIAGEDLGLAPPPPQSRDLHLG
jgi:hypothetical protein